jgi:hypothetical protein
MNQGQIQQPRALKITCCKYCGCYFMITSRGICQPTEHSCHKYYLKIDNPNIIHPDCQLPEWKEEQGE